MVLVTFIPQVFENLVFTSSSSGKGGEISNDGGPLLKSDSCLVTESSLLKMAYQIRIFFPPLPPDET
jgi:hypothetical protein